MQFAGTIKSWNDERGFGFIEPTLGGEDIFVHVKAYRSGAPRPAIGQRVTFEVEAHADGKKRARRVELMRPPRRRVRAPARRPAPPGGATSYLAIALFGLVFLAASMFWRVPGWVALLYLVASISTFLAYAIDKSAAASGAWRISENTLLLLGLAGGWPGAIVAQRVLRHKSVKQPFRTAFWGTVLMNMLAFLALGATDAYPLFQG